MVILFATSLLVPPAFAQFLGFETITINVDRDSVNAGEDLRVFGMVTPRPPEGAAAIPVSIFIKTLNPIEGMALASEAVGMDPAGNYDGSIMIPEDIASGTYIVEAQAIGVPIVVASVQITVIGEGEAPPAVDPPPVVPPPDPERAVAGEGPVVDLPPPDQPEPMPPPAGEQPPPLDQPPPRRDIQPTASTSGGSLLFPIVGGVVVLAIIVAVAVLLMRRKGT